MVSGGEDLNVQVSSGDSKASGVGENDVPEHLEEAVGTIILCYEQLESLKGSLDEVGKPIFEAAGRATPYTMNGKPFVIHAITDFVKHTTNNPDKDLFRVEWSVSN
jgi:hypothetical protein